MTQRLSPLLAVGASLCLSLSAAEADSVPKLTAGPLSASGAFNLDNDTRRAVSGIACAGDRCVVGFDEGRSARFAKLTETTFVAEAAPLVLRAGDPDEELDIEGAAIGGGRLYLTGSHAKARKEKPSAEPDKDDIRCKPHPDARRVYRFTLDASGLPAADAKPEEPKGGGLLGALKGTPLEGAEARCLVLGRGLNAEGLAFKDGRLFFGFRGPKPEAAPGASDEEKLRAAQLTYVASVDAEALFGSSPAKAEILMAPVGAGRAIRDMQAISDGFLLLVGPDDVKTNPSTDFSVMRWSGENGRGVTDLGRIPTEGKTRPQGPGCNDEETKPEAMSVTETADGWKLAVLSDGMCDGGPMWFDVTRPPN